MHIALYKPDIPQNTAAIIRLGACLNLKIRRNDRIGVIGANGSGKSTLIKILQGIYPPKTGKIKFGENVNVKYFDQNKESINLNKYTKIINAIVKKYKKINRYSRKNKNRER